MQGERPGNPSVGNRPKVFGNSGRFVAVGIIGLLRLFCRLTANNAESLFDTV
jgi:hypothetical protein